MPKLSITKEIFIEKMKEKYEQYGNINFTTMLFKASKTTIECNKCGKENTKTALRHIECTCSTCYSNMSQRLTTEEFIKRSDNLYGIGVYKYDKTNYINAHEKVEIYCMKHKGYFKISPQHFTKKTAKGCNICTKRSLLSKDEFLYRVESLYPYLNFRKLDNNGNEITNYEGSMKYLNVWCNRHKGIWTVYGNTILRGITQCGVCSGKTLKTKEEFINLSNTIHNEKYDYSLVEYTGNKNHVKIICKEHIHEQSYFLQTPSSHLSGRGCPKCGKYGYQQGNPGYFYIQELTNDISTIYKIGITGDLVRRITEQQRHSSYKHKIIYSQYFEDGKLPLELETEIKRTIQCGIISSEDLGDGFSETINHDDIHVVYQIVEKFMKEINNDNQ